MNLLYILIPTRAFQVTYHPGIYPLGHGVYIFLIKIELDRGSPLSYWPPLIHIFFWIPWICLPWSYLPWIWVNWYELPWRVIPCKCITYGSWVFIWSMPKVFFSCLMKPLFLLNWVLGVPLCLLVPSGFQIFCLQPLISKVRYIVIIIICTLEGLKCGQFWPNWRLLMLSCMHSLKIVIKNQIKLRANVSSLCIPCQA